MYNTRLGILLQCILPSLQILQVIRDWNILRLGRTEEILHDRIRVVPKGNLDGTIKAMKVSIVAGALVGLVLLHQRQKLFGTPASGLKVIVIGCRSPGIHLNKKSDGLDSAITYHTHETLSYHKVDRASSTKDIRTRDNGPPSIEIFRWSRVIEGSGLRVKFHVTGIDAWVVNPITTVSHINF